jgi:hypothetical protein
LNKDEGNKHEASEDGINNGCTFDAGVCMAGDRCARCQAWALFAVAQACWVQSMPAHVPVMLLLMLMRLTMPLAPPGPEGGEGVELLDMLTSSA